jgi:N-acetyl-anhydromuramyl-L-alanine amidase AmpD
MKIELSKREVELIQKALVHYGYATDGLTLREERERGSEVQLFQNRLTKKEEGG